MRWFTAVTMLVRAPESDPTDSGGGGGGGGDDDIDITIEDDDDGDDDSAVYHAFDDIDDIDSDGDDDSDGAADALIAALNGADNDQPDDTDEGDKPKDAPEPKLAAGTKVMVEGKELIIPESGDLADATFTTKIDGEETTMRVGDAIRAERTYQAADRYMREQKESAKQLIQKVNAVRDNPLAILELAGHADPGAALAAAALREIEVDEYRAIRSKREKSIEDYRRMEELERSIQGYEEQRAKASADAKALNGQVSETNTRRKALIRQRAEQVPDLLKKAGLSDEDPIVESLIFRSCQLYPDIEPQALADRVIGLAANLKPQPDFSKMAVKEMIEVIGQAGIKKLTEAIMQTKSRNQRATVVKKVKRKAKADRDAAGRYTGGGVSIDDLL